jgi:hypothetical protein
MAEIRERLTERVPNLPRLDPSRVPAHKPPVYDLSLDDRRRLWVRLSGPNADSTVFDVFSRDGRYAETVLMRFRVDAWVPPVVKGDTVWAVVTDELDVQYVARSRIHSAVRSGHR